MAIPIVRCWVVLLVSLIAAPGSVVSVFVRTKLTVASAPPASGPYGFDVASAVKPAGSVSVTEPLWLVVDQLWTSTGRLIVSPMPIDCTAAERPSRRAVGASVVEPLVELAPLAPALEPALDGRHDAHDVSV